MKNKEINKKLSLNKRTVANLIDDEMKTLWGRDHIYSEYSVFPCKPSQPGSICVTCPSDDFPTVDTGPPPV